MVLAAILAPAVLAQTGQKPPAHATSQSAADRNLVGSWQGVSGTTVTYLPDGTGKNADGSRFSWHLEGDSLLVQALGPDGKPVGETGKIGILLTRDSREYSIFLENGRRKITFYRLRPDGQRDTHQTAEGGKYPPHIFAPKASGDDDGATPTVLGPGGPGGDKTPPKSQSARVLHPEEGPPAVLRGNAHVQIGPNVQVSHNLPFANYAEVTVVADPKHAARLLAASMLNLPGNSVNPKINVYASFDSGRTWHLTLQRNHPDPESYADPCFAYGADGTVSFANMHFQSDMNQKGCRVQFTSSHDGGRTWRTSTESPSYEDRPFLAADSDSHTGKDRLYCLSGVPDRALLVSTDHGRTFLPAVSYEFPIAGEMLNGNCVVASDGSLIHLYESFPGTQEQKTDPDQATHEFSSDEPDIPWSIKIVRSVDHGQSFLQPQTIAAFPSPAAAYWGLPMLAADAPCAQSHGHVYAVWAEEHAGESRVMAAVSRDNGATWSRPVMLSEQTGKKYSPIFLPSVAVNRAGVVGVCWYDTRDIPLDQSGWDLRFRASRDGGRTWLPSVRINSMTTLDLKKHRQRALPETRFDGIRPGDTAGLTADASGVFHPVWIDHRTGSLQVWTTTVTVK